MKQLLAVLSFFFVLASVDPSVALGVPKSDLWDRWTKHNAASNVSVDHQAWGDFLKKYVVIHKDGINRIAYSKVGPSDKNQLAGYISALEAIDVDNLSRTEQRAFWTNLYNALTVKIILDHYPVETIQDIDISPGFFESGPWGRKILRVKGIPISLNDIEHRILRPIWQDPRTHYSVNCASLGCPNLVQVPYTRKNMETLLERAAKDFINHERGVWFDGPDLGASSIFKWFSEDFGEDIGAVLAHIKKYAEPRLKQRLERHDSINVYHYDWDLNEDK